MRSESGMQSLFEPRSIAVVGASRDETKIGLKILRNILEGGFEGAVYPVNPQGGEILGKAVSKRVDLIEGEVDVACLVVPAKFVYPALEDCAGRGVRHAMIISSGFSEVGNVSEEMRMVDYARSHGIRILGPNIFGIYSSRARLNSTFSAAGISPGHVAIITQSGALGIAMIGKTAVENMGLSAIISIGNKSDIDEADLLEYLVPQEETRVILMYIEGVKRGDRFVEALKKATRAKPVILIKSGRSRRGALAAASHTGSLAGSDDVFSAVVRQCGAIRAENLEEAFNWCKFFASAPMPSGDNCVIVTNGGGVGVMATDACEKYGVSLYDDIDGLKTAFSPVTPDFGSTKNPIDITGGAGSAEYIEALRVSALNQSIGSTIALYCETATFDADNLPRMIEESYREHMHQGKPVVYSLVGGESTVKAMDVLREKSLPVFPDVYSAVSCLGSVYYYRNFLREYKENVDIPDIDEGAIQTVVDRVLKDGRNFLLAHEAQEVMRAAGLPIPITRIARTLEEALGFADEMGYPVVMKVVSRDILHKSDAGGVALDLENREEVMDAYQAILYNCRAYKPDAVIDGIEISEMVKKGTEMIIGARVDKSFGPIVMCGLGGIYVEVMKDVTFRALPMNTAEAFGMVKEIKSYPLLLGVRGEERKDIEGAVAAIMKLGSVILKNGHITDIEINPLMVYDQGQGVKAVDVRILITQTNRSETP